jgi:hypothetical protein
MAEYTSLKGLVGGSQDQETLVALEATVDSVRFRFDGVPSDLAQERPPGFSRSMAEIMAHMRMQEGGVLCRAAGHAAWRAGPAA